VHVVRVGIISGDRGCFGVRCVHDRELLRGDRPVSGDGSMRGGLVLGDVRNGLFGLRVGNVSGERWIVGVCGMHGGKLLCVVRPVGGYGPVYGGPVLHFLGHGVLGLRGG